MDRQFVLASTSAVRLTHQLAQQGVQLSTPFKSARRQPRPCPYWLTNLRRRIDTVVVQLVQRYQAKRHWARAQWHLSSRWLCMILSHSFAIFAYQQAGLASSLALAELLTD